MTVRSPRTEGRFPELRPPRWTAALPALIAGLGMAGLAGAERDLEAAAEGRYLAWTATAVLVAAAGVARRPWSLNVLAFPTLVVLAFVAIPPPGAARETAVGALLCLGLGAMLLDNLLDRRADLLASPGSLDPRRLLELGATLAAALIGLELLLRQGELLGGSTLRLLVVLVAMPTVAAAAATVFYARLGVPALLGAAAMLLVAGGTRSNVVLVLVVALLADVAADMIEQRWRVGLYGAGGGLALALTLATMREPAFGAMLVATAAAIVWRRFAFAVALVAAGALAVWLPPEAALAWPQVAAGMSLLVFAAPHLLGRGDLRTAAAAVLLATAGLRFLPAPQALLGALALWTVFCAERPVARSPDDPPPTGPWQKLALRGDAATLGLCCQGGLLLFAALSATLPWLRPAHLDDRLRALGLDHAGERWLTAALLVALAHGAAALVRRAPRPRALIAMFAGVLLPTAALAGWGAFAPRQPLLESQRALTADDPAWTAEGAGCGVLLLDTALANSGPLVAGQTVGHVGSAGMSPLALRLGEHTDEWAALGSGGRRGESRPWLHWVAPGPEGAFFGARYRAKLDLGPSCVGDGNPQPTGIIVQRDPGLPAEVDLILFFALHVGETAP